MSAAAAAVRPLGVWRCTALVMGNMIGSGIFLLPAALAAFGGISVFGWLFSATGALLLALVLSRLARMVPKTGGPYAYTRRGFGDFSAFLVAWGYWISLMVGNAAIAVAMVSYLTVFFPVLAANSVLAAVTAIAVIWLLTFVNALGVRDASVVQIVTVVLKVLPLLALGTLGFLYFDPVHFSPMNVSESSTFSAITATATLTLWAFLGLEAATIPAGDVHDPERTIPRATVMGTLATCAIYIASTMAVMGILGPSELLGSNAPFSDAAARIWGSWASYAVTVGAVVSCVGTLNGWILLTGQTPMAAAMDGLFPRRFARVSGANAPVFSLVVSCALATVLIAASYSRTLVDLFTYAIKLSTMTALIPYVFSSMAILMIFSNERSRYRGQRLIGICVIAVLAFAFSVWAIAGAGHETVWAGFLLLLAGMPFYVWLTWRQGAVAPAAAVPEGGE